MCSPQGEGPLLVAAQPGAVNCGGAGNGVQVVGTVGQCGNPLTVPLRLLFPENKPRGENTTRNTIIISVVTVVVLVEVPEVGGGLGADGDGFVLLIIPFQDLLHF